MALYSLFVPAQSVGASLVYFDMFNAAGSNRIVEVTAVIPVVSGAVAVTGALGIDLFLTRTTAVGTTGTAATSEGTSLTACTFAALDNSQPINPSITARLTPGGGATAGAVISWACVFGEETNSAAYTPSLNLARLSDNEPGITVLEGSGIRVVQSSVAATGTVGFRVLFKTTHK